MANNVIEMHSTWLAINSIVGCTNGCKYCFLQATNSNICAPQIKATAEESVEQLLASPYYDKNIPLCLLPNTDAFLNEKNISYTKQLLNLLHEKNIKNPIAIITKCAIPSDFIEYINELQKDNMKIIFYLSYSGLSAKYEPNINLENIKENFKNLKAASIPFIHYFRPFIPENSEPEKIKEVLDFVNQYTDISVVSGLKLKNDFSDKIDFWDAISLNKQECINSTGVWPKSAYDFFNENYQEPQQIFEINSCAISNLLQEPNRGFYNTKECLNNKTCPEIQRKRCALLRKRLDFNLDKTIILLLKRINRYTEELEIEKTPEKIILKNIKLTMGDMSYLTYMLGFKITIENKIDEDNYFSSTYTNAKKLVI